MMSLYSFSRFSLFVCLFSLFVEHLVCFSESLTKFHLNDVLPVSPNGRFVYGSFQNRTTCFSKYSFNEPSNLHELQFIVEEAIRRNETIKAVGNLHSATDIICTDGTPISMSKINFINVNSNNVVVGAGVTVRKVVEELHRHGKTLIHIPAYSGITMGGAIGCGSHGASLRHGIISDQLVELTVIDGTGKIRNVSNQEHLKAFKVHLGLLGIVYSLTLKIVPLYKMAIYNYPENEEILFNEVALKMAAKYDFFQMWWFPSDHSVVVSRGLFIDDKAEGNSYSTFIPNEEESSVRIYNFIMEQLQKWGNLFGMRILQMVTKYSLFGYAPFRNPIFTEDGFTLKNPAVGFGYRLMASYCDEGKCPWGTHPEENALAMNIQYFSKAIKTIKEILRKSPAEFPLVGFFIRFSKSSDGILAISNKGTTFHIDWAENSRFDPFTTPRTGLTATQTIMQTLIDRFDARPHWGKNGLIYFTQNYLLKRGNDLSDFRSIMKLFDPHGIFLNDFGRRIMGTSNQITKDPRDKHCAIRDNCLCETDFDCGSSTENIKCAKSICQIF